MRRSGILMHISSLPNDYGIGKLGKEAYAFVDFLEKAHQKCWQILPISPTSYGDSPYQSFSVHAGNPYFIDLEALEKDGYLKAAEYKNIEWGDDKGSRPVNRVLVNHASSKSELARENRRRIREIKKIQRRKKHYTEIDRDPKEKDENLTDRN